MNRNIPPPLKIKKRLTLVDCLLYVAVALFIFYAVYRVNDVLIYHWNWSKVLGFLVKFDDETQSWASNLLLQGLWTTLRLALWATVLATVFGIIMGYWRTCQNLTLRIISRTYVELIRNMPPIVFIFIFYFFVSSQIFPALGIEDIDSEGAFASSTIFHFMFGDPRLFSNFLAGMICLALFEGAYITEIVRAGIQTTE
ncbi:MAG: polar amino acid transport system permease protein, partial [Candidatus Azotimanducaceae bacterium]